MSYTDEKKQEENQEDKPFIQTRAITCEQCNNSILISSIECTNCHTPNPYYNQTSKPIKVKPKKLKSTKAKTNLRRSKHHKIKPDQKSGWENTENIENPKKDSVSFDESVVVKKYDPTSSILKDNGYITEYGGLATGPETPLDESSDDNDGPLFKKLSKSIITEKPKRDCCDIL